MEVENAVSVNVEGLPERLHLLVQLLGITGILHINIKIIRKRMKKSEKGDVYLLGDLFEAFKVL